jgi:hypothetical protein
MASADEFPQGFDRAFYLATRWADCSHAEGHRVWLLTKRNPAPASVNTVWRSYDQVREEESAAVKLATCVVTRSDMSSAEQTEQLQARCLEISLDLLKERLADEQMNEMHTYNLPAARTARVLEGHYDKGIRDLMILIKSVDKNVRSRHFDLVFDDVMSIRQKKTELASLIRSHNVSRTEETAEDHRLFLDKYMAYMASKEAVLVAFWSFCRTNKDVEEFERKLADRQAVQAFVRELEQKPEYSYSDYLHFGSMAVAAEGWLDDHPVWGRRHDLRTVVRVFACKLLDVGTGQPMGPK